MREFMPGVVVAAVGTIIGMICYRMGFNRGVGECTRIVKTAVEVQEAVEQKQKDET